MWEKAWKDTKNFFGWNLKTFLLPAVLYIAGLAVYWQVQGYDAVKTELVSFISFGLIPVVVAFILLFLFHLARAPVFIKFEKEKKPRLEVVDAVRAHYGTKGTSWGLIVSNLGTNRADDCRGTIVDIDFADEGKISMDWYPKNEQLQWTELLPSIKNEFNIPGLENRNLYILLSEIIQKQTLELDSYPDTESIYIAYARDELSRQRSALHPGSYIVGANVYESRIILVISISSKDAIPTYTKCFFTHDYSKYNRDYKLVILEKNIKEKPSINKCRQQ